MRQILLKREEEGLRQDAELKAEIKELKAEILIKDAALASAMQQVRGPGSRYRLLSSTNSSFLSFAISTTVTLRRKYRSELSQQSLHSGATLQPAAPRSAAV